MRAEINKNPLTWGKQFIAKKVASSINPQNIIAVSGSHQIDLTAFYITSVLSFKFKTKTNVINKNYLQGLLDNLVKFRPDIDKLVVGVNLIKNGDILKYLEVIKPGILVIPQLVDLKDYLIDLNLEIKSLIKQIPASGYIIANLDNQEIKEILEEAKCQIFSIGTDNQTSQVWADDIRLENFQTIFGLNYGVERVEIHLKAIGKHFVYPALGTAAVGILNGLSLIKIKKSLESVENLPNNLELREGIKGWWLLDDGFDNDPISLSWGLQVLTDFGAKRKILILGEIKDLVIHQNQIAQEIFKIKPDLILFSGHGTDSLASELIKLGISAERIFQDQTNSEIVAKILTYAGRGDVVLIKGGRSQRFDEVIERISKPFKL